MRIRVAAQLRAEGCGWPDLVATVLELRGRLGIDRTAFADLLRVDEAVVEDLESGRVPPWDAPAGLLAMDAGIEWTSLR